MKVLIVGQGPTGLFESVVVDEDGEIVTAIPKAEIIPPKPEPEVFKLVDTRKHMPKPYFIEKSSKYHK